MSSVAARRRIQVLIPGLLQSYTNGNRSITLEVPEPHGQQVLTLSHVMTELDARYPGMRFRVIDEQGRIRPHIKMFLDSELARELGAPISDHRALMIVGALSGG